MRVWIEGRRWLILALLLAIRPAAAWADVTMKILVVNPSETEVREFHIRSPLPPEIKAEHVLDADGLNVEYDSQAGTYFLVGTVTLKPKQSLTRTIVLKDVWVIPSEQLGSLRQEVDDVTKKLAGSAYEEQGRVLASAIGRNLGAIEDSQEQPSGNTQQHINMYHENIKMLQSVESDLVSLRQLMVMAALRPSSTPLTVGGEGRGAAKGHERGGLSLLATWRMIFLIVILLGGISLSFFLVWQRQLKLQLERQASAESGEPLASQTGSGTPPASGAMPPPSPPSQPKVPS